MASKGKSGEVSKFKWTNEMVQDLLDSLSEFKSIMEFNNFDFNADKPLPTSTLISLYHSKLQLKL